MGRWTSLSEGILLRAYFRNVLYARDGNLANSQQRPFNVTPYHTSQMVSTYTSCWMPAQLRDLLKFILRSVQRLRSTIARVPCFYNT